MSAGEVGRHLVWVLDRGWWEPSLGRRGGGAASSKSWTVSIWQPMDVACKGGTEESKVEQNQQCRKCECLAGQDLGDANKRHNRVGVGQEKQASDEEVGSGRLAPTLPTTIFFFSPSLRQSQNWIPKSQKLDLKIPKLMFHNLFFQICFFHRFPFHFPLSLFLYWNSFHIPTRMNIFDRSIF